MISSRANDPIVDSLLAEGHVDAAAAGGWDLHDVAAGDGFVADFANGPAEDVAAALFGGLDVVVEDHVELLASGDVDGEELFTGAGVEEGDGLLAVDVAAVGVFFELLAAGEGQERGNTKHTRDERGGFAIVNGLGHKDLVKPPSGRGGGLDRVSAKKWGRQQSLSSHQMEAGLSRFGVG